MLCKLLILITGPTATGKTEIGLEVARQIQKSEILSVDSRQLYRHMDIGTAKVSASQRAEIPHHFIDIIEPDTAYSAGAYARAARQVITEIWQRDGTPLLVGGTGLYWQAVLDGFFADEGDYQPIRDKINERYNRYGLIPLYEELGRLDPIVQGRLNPNDKQRIIRGLEVALGGGEPLSHRWLEGRDNAFDCQPIMVCISRNRVRLYELINNRVDLMVTRGLVAEVQRLMGLGYDRDTYALGTLGYLEIIEYLDGDRSLAEAADLIKQRTRRFAKRQITWCRRDHRLRWLDIDYWGSNGVVDRIVAQWEYLNGK